MPTKKKLKTRIATKKDTADLVQTVVKVLRSAEKRNVEKKYALQTNASLNADSPDSIAALRRDMHRMQEIFDDRFNRIEDKVNSLRVFADDTRRTITEQNKSIDDRIDQIVRALNESLEKGSKKNVKLVKTVYKDHGEEISLLKETIREMKEDANDKSQLLDNDLQFLAKDLSKVKEAVDELSIKRLGYIPASKAELSLRQLDTTTGLTIERMNQKMRQLERKVGDVSTSPSRQRPLAPSTTDATSDKLIGKLLLRVENCERQLDRIYFSSGNERPSQTQVSTIELKSNVKALSKNTSRAFRSLSAGLEDIQKATLLLYDWADKVHKSFETVSYKLEYPTNICPRAQVSLCFMRNEDPTLRSPGDFRGADFVFTDV